MACQKYIRKQDVALELSHSPARVSHRRGELPSLQAGAVPCTAAGPRVRLTAAVLHVLSLQSLFPTSMLRLTQPPAGNIRDFCHNLPFCPGQDLTGMYFFFFSKKKKAY